jgi:riboflavin synthase
MTVNLERAMRADGRLGGHLVQGHVDGTGSVVSVTPSEGSTVFRFRVAEEGSKYLIDKGSIALDGISLTVVNPKGAEFDTWIIPHTLANTNLGSRKPGEAVNVEFDVLARYAERLLAGRI